jgi:peptidoglycan/LPS O-acetylase OafA/YrhL
MTISLPVRRAEGVASRRFFELALLDNRYPALHGMRVLAIASFVQHELTIFLAPHADIPVGVRWAEGWLTAMFGMDLFFILSGFLIGSQLLRAIESSGSQRVRAFYLRRALRTIPLYYALLTLFALATHLTAAQRRHLWLEYALLSNYRFPFASGDLVMPWGWSLALVEHFYLTVPLIFFLLWKLKSDRARLSALCVAWGSALVVRLALLLRHPNWSERQLYDYVYCRTHARFDTFLAGIAVAYVHHRWHEPIARWLHDPRARAALAMPSLACLWLLVHPWMFGWGGVRLMDVFAWGTLTSIMYAGFILLVLNDSGGWIRDGLSAPIFRVLASVGYGVYLTYLPLCERIIVPVSRSLLKSWHWPSALVWPLALGSLLFAALCIAYVLHMLIERPCSRLSASPYSKSGTGSTSSA